MFETVDWGAVKLIKLLDILSKGSANGIVPFSKATTCRDGVFYDDRCKRGGDSDSERYPVVCDYLIDELHHDVISTYDDFFDNVDISAVIDETGDVYIEVSDTDSYSSIVVEDGKWYIASWE